MLAGTLAASVGSGGDEARGSSASSGRDVGSPIERRRRYRHVLLGTGIVVVVLVLAVSTFLAMNRGGEQPLQVTLEALDARPSGAFATSVVSVPSSKARKFAAKRTVIPLKSGRHSAAVFRGDATGLYGSDPSGSIADMAGLGKQLGADRHKAAVWADAMGVPPDKVASTVRHLTPVLLTRDTAVVEYRYVSGRASSQPVVLEAGTAVGVNNHGAPVVRLESGNPLSEVSIADHAGPEFIGEKWGGFDSSEVVTIERAERPMQAISTVGIGSGKPVKISLGGTVSLGGYLGYGEDGISIVSYDGKVTTHIVEEPIAFAFDDGAGGIIYQGLRVGAQDPGAAQNVVSDPPVRPDQAPIWYLPAGKAEPVKLVDTDDPSSHWPVALGAGVLGGHSVVLYEVVRKDDVDSWGSGGSVPGARLHVLDIDTRKDVTLNSGGPGSGPATGSGYETSVSHVAITADRLAYSLEVDTTATWYFFNQKLQPVRNACSKTITLDQDLNDPCEGSGIDDEGHLVRAITAPDYGPVSAIGLTDLTSGKSVKTVPLPDAPDRFANLDVSGHRAIMSFYDVSNVDIKESIGVDLADGKTREFDSMSRFHVLRAPIVRPKASPSYDSGAPPTSTATTTSTVVPTTTESPLAAPTWGEIEDAAISTPCASGTLIDGDYTSSDGGTELALQRDTLVRGLPSPDAGPLTVVAAFCSSGGVGGPLQLVAFSSGGAFYAGSGLSDSDGDPGQQYWDSTGLEEPPRSSAAFKSMHLDGNDLVVLVNGWTADSCYSCYTGTVQLTFNASGKQLRLVAAKRVG